MGAPPQSPLSAEDRVRLLEQLAREHKLLRAKVIELTALAEAAVARAVIAEKHVADLQREVEAERAHVHALQHSATMRLAAPARRLYAALRRRTGR